MRYECSEEMTANGKAEDREADDHHQVGTRDRMRGNEQRQRDGDGRQHAAQSFASGTSRDKPSALRPTSDGAIACTPP